MNSEKGQVIVISGPSGVGKSTICHRLCEILPAEFSVSVTTRRPRPGEAHARDYRYATGDEFERLREKGALLEWAEVYGHFYGTPLDTVQKAVSEGRIIILEIDIKGCLQVREKMPEAKTIFLLPPTPEEQKRRIEGRNTDAAEVIRQRLSKADGEIRYAMDCGCYDEFLINDDLDNSVSQIVGLVSAGTK
ncbi:MAG: guanylate kinase [Phycisphaerales bacterium]|nr:guanylate kinase [Phycisphaerales bacterium]